MKSRFYIPFSILCLFSCAQQADKETVVADSSVPVQESPVLLPDSLIQVPSDTAGQEEAIQVLKGIFEAYTAHEEGIDSEDNKNAVTQHLRRLGTVRRREDLMLLINMWHYYDPTDYSCRQMILDVLLRDKAAAIAALEYRMQHKKRWETGTTEFHYLLEALKAGQ